MHAETKPKNPLFGLMAQFATPELLQDAASKATEAGYKDMDAYTPFPIEDLTERMGKPRTKLSALVFLAGISGLFGGLGLQIYASAISYPMNIGGRPLISLPSFIPVAYECTILFASFTAAIGMILLNGLPRPHHPVFEVQAFQRASCDKFFLCIESTDTKFDATETKSFLKTLKPEDVYDVPNET